MGIPIKIETQDKLLVFELFNVKQTRQGLQIEPTDGAVLRYESTFIREAVGIPDIITLTLQLGKDVAVGVFSAWLYDKLKERTSKLQIAGKETPVEKDAIERALST